MVKLPDEITDRIYRTYLDANAKEPERVYLGCSELGEECCRRLWYSFRHVARPEFEGRILRLFNSGHQEESRVIADLRAAKYIVHDRDANGHQFDYSACRGHLRGHIDGVIEGLEASKRPHLLEIKTSSDKAFKSLEKDGCEKSKPVHFAQMQLYMGMAELERALYVVVNKNDDSIYTERIKFDAVVFNALLLKADRIISAESAPDRISTDPSYYICSWCPFRDNCFGDARPRISCRTCVHSSPAKEGKWECAVGGQPPTVCERHIIIPDLLANWAEPVSGDPTHVIYEMRDGRKFANVGGTCFPVPEVPCFTSEELAAIPIEAIGNDKVELARAILRGKVVNP